ncbi:hypothetical protein RO3G_05599 [Rhizopus delemar RA 99-880]|uniref:Uncharacterized protein n=1 Tax=Rhizopus delemar (strain RA 99-880 / ATCC MYA-4621 / FGSC 9543 / NRRL 43880) TaxID=246409 RepID=I1BXG4_RHIO9|nr:hypothetical protein RO3G_05599 [Rhizopus delemar RA 99-880]|eukprot:EIE80894.1 hypothetical protein RO3G_05599 [Rhizopus delemar RA 99-880]
MFKHALFFFGKIKHDLFIQVPSRKLQKKTSLCFFAKHVEEADVVLNFNVRVTFIPYPLFG